MGRGKGANEKPIMWSSRKKKSKTETIDRPNKQIKNAINCSYEIKGPPYP